MTRPFRVLSGAGIAAVTAAALLGTVTTAAAETTVLSVGSWAGPNHAISAGGLKTWNEAIQKKSNGTLRLDVSFPPVNPRVMYDRAREGIDDIAWGFNGYTAGRFATYELAELPNLGAGSEAASIAYWRTHEKFLAKANEYPGVRLLGLFVQPPSVIHTSKQITSLADMKGMKIRAGGGVQAKVAGALGMTAVQAPVADAYQMIKDGVVDGTFFPTETALSFKLNEVAKHQLGIPGGLFGGAYFVVMNPASYEKLSPEHRKVIDETSGELLSKTIGHAWGTAEAAAIETLKPTADGGFRWADEKLTAAVMEQLKPIDATAIEAANKKGVDGAAALEFLRAEARKLQAELKKN